MYRMKFSLVFTSALLLAALPAAAASLSPQDSNYLTNAMRVQLGRYALASVTAKHGTGSVKSLAQSIAKQAAQDTRTLDALANRYGVSIPKKPTFFDTYHYSQLSGLRGSALDARFVMALRTDDGMDQSSAKSELQKGTNGTVKAWAKKRYAAMQHELVRLKHYK